jgi:hypothetical protein
MRVVRSVKPAVWLTTLVLLSGCAVMESSPAPVLEDNRRWLLLPVQNYSGTPQAGERAEVLLIAMLQQRGLTSLEMYPATSADDTLPELDERRRYTRALEWAQRRSSAYAITGNVAEWRYKSGPDSEPAVGLTLQIVEIPSGKLVWSAAGARSGWGRESLTGTAQKLLQDLLASVRVNGRSP